MKKLRVINVMLSRGLGGIEQAAIDYCEALRLAGYETYAIVHPKAEIKNTLDTLVIPYATLPNMGEWDLFAILKLRGIIKKVGADCVIAHGNRALRLLKYAAPAQVKTIAVMHNYKITPESASITLSPTRDLIRHTESLKIARKNIHHLPNMVRVTPEAPPRTHHTPPIIGAMGRFVTKKGFNIWIESLALLKSRNCEFRAIIAGAGEEETALKKLVSAKGLENIVTFAGWVANKQQFFDAIDIFCLPSLEEPFGIALIEAMAQNLPVIATNSEGPSEIITHGLDGLLVEKSNASAFADSLQKLLADPTEAGLLARNAYDTVKKNYDLPVISRKLALVLESL